MSAWVVDKVHVDLMVEVATRTGNDSLTYRENGEWKVAARSKRDEIGQMLVMENVASVSHRYPGDDVAAGELPGPTEAYYLGPYRYTDRQYQPSWAEVLNLVRCYEYQACEHPGWEESGAHSLCKAMFVRAASHFAKGPWGWDESDLADKPKSISLLDMLP